MIIIQPSGGLCNRMRVINSAYVLAEKRNEELVVLWYTCDELNCTFENLFLPTTEIKLINICSLLDLRKLYYQFTSLQHFSNDDIVNNKTNGILHSDFEYALKNRIYISTWEHFYPPKHYDLFVPTENLQKRIDAITGNFGSHCVGVHIRRTDNIPSKDKSSTNQFITAMEQEIQADANVMFYLATDDKTEEAALRNHFSDRILSNKGRVLDRNSTQGIQDAVIDLFCLSRTDKILGSFYSSFTDIAADLQHIPKIIVGDDKAK